MDPSQIVFTKQGKTFDSRIMTVLKCTIRKRWFPPKIHGQMGQSRQITDRPPPMYDIIMFCQKEDAILTHLKMQNAEWDKPPPNIFGQKKLIVICPYWLAWKKDWLSRPYMFWSGDSEGSMGLGIGRGSWQRYVNMSGKSRKLPTVSRFQCQKYWFNV